MTADEMNQAILASLRQSSPELGPARLRVLLFALFEREQGRRIGRCTLGRLLGQNQWYIKRHLRSLQHDGWLAPTGTGTRVLCRLVPADGAAALVRQPSGTLGELTVPLDGALLEAIRAAWQVASERERRSAQERRSAHRRHYGSLRLGPAPPEAP